MPPTERCPACDHSDIPTSSCPHCGGRRYVPPEEAARTAASLRRERDLAGGDAPDPEVVGRLRARLAALEVLQAGSHHFVFETPEMSALGAAIREFERLGRLADRREENPRG